MKNLFSIFTACMLFLNAATAQIVNIPDANFKNALVNSNCAFIGTSTTYTDVDTNNDGEVQVSEAEAVRLINVDSRVIASLEGILSFTNLQYLNCIRNQLQSLNLQGLTNLQTLYCRSNQLQSLNVQGLTNLQTLWCFLNQLPSLNVQGLTSLQDLKCSNNQLLSLNVQGLTNLQDLYCGNNQLSYLNVHDATNLQMLDCSNNQLTSLFVKNGIDQGRGLVFSNNPNLAYICCDDIEINTIISQAPTTCTVNSYCSFTPGGTFYTIQGNSKLDLNTNGCDANDGGASNMKFNITNDTINGSAIANASGNYSIPVQAGTHTFTPVLENPTYYTISPTTTQVTFPTAASPFTQNFCITPNGTHHDVEATLIPTSAARPGFDANYKIIFKNKGNQTTNGVVSFGFDDAKMDMVSTSIAPSTTATGARTWNYTLLKPFETRTIDLVLNINSPMETPAVNTGDALYFTSNITLGANDEMPNDNAAVLNQTVINAFDPNDKTCSEGRQILLSKVGDYLHYTIRFENTGTANATNIVVKDMIDLAKYDIASLQMLKASHDCRVRMLNGNQVEFIFENINLPFTAPNKYGYVAFKIKTKSTLVVGDIATNKADIFFDYNFPIITNTASTQVVNVLAASPDPSRGVETDVTLVPNPVSDILTFKTDATIDKCEIYDNLGRNVSVLNADNVKAVNVAHLPKGIYFVKLYAQDSFTVRKMVKN